MTDRHAVTSERIIYMAPPSLSSFINVTRSLSTFQPQPNCSEQCTICWEPLNNTETCATIVSCSHKFHQKCIDECLRREPRCPICRQPIGAPQGTCPSGIMKTEGTNMPCPGYNGAATIQIEYELPPGSQAPYHENPGRRYWPTYRIAFLPDTDEGRRLLTRLKYAWTCGLLFTIGTSLTSGQSNAIVWTSIHHKTSIWGGPYSFPDPNYLANCNGSLDALCVPDADACLQRLQNTSNNDVVDEYLEEITYDAPTSLSSSPFISSSFLLLRDNVDGDCSICLEKLDNNSITIHKCSHNFHHKCIEDCMDRELSCPVCRQIVGDSPQGRSPSGTMKIKTLKRQSCPGSACNDTIQVEYQIPPGTQKQYHQNRGVPYDGTVRIAYIPKNKEGLRLLARLKYAWKHGLVFKIGTSLASGKHNAVVWAGIDHKTKLRGHKHGYPDSNYFATCNASLDDARVPSAEVCQV